MSRYRAVRIKGPHQTLSCGRCCSGYDHHALRAEPAAVVEVGLKATTLSYGEADRAASESDRGRLAVDRQRSRESTRAANLSDSGTPPPFVQVGLSGELPPTFPPLWHKLGSTPRQRNGLCHNGFYWMTAGDGFRTRDPYLGKTKLQFRIQNRRKSGPRHLLTPYFDVD